VAPTTIRVILYSADSKLQALLTSALRRDFDVRSEPDWERLKQTLCAGQTDVLLLDLDPESFDADQHVRIFEEINAAGVAVIILTEDAARPTALDLVTRGAHSYCRKPPALRELKAIIRRAGEHAAMKRELEERRGNGFPSSEAMELLRCDGLIGSSAEMRTVYDLIHRVTNLNASVLITGGSGTGKELIARAIHNLGDRSKAPFIAVSCGAIPETLIESELFGHEKGAFTGTNGTRIGYFEQAENGTILIDEIGELSLQTQVKLLRVLQQREFSRLGSGRAIPLNARVIFATHRNLSRMVAEGTFRLDLFYRINVMSIEAPPLWRHPEDISALAQFFVRKYSEIFQKHITGLAPGAVALLQGYEWPGNVRELENAIQSAIICADTEVIQASDLPERLQEPNLVDNADIAQTGSFEQLLRDFKVKLATKAIQECNGNKTLAARSLDISRAYLHRLIRSREEAEAADPIEEAPIRPYGGGSSGSRWSSENRPSKLSQNKSADTVAGPLRATFVREPSREEFTIARPWAEDAPRPSRDAGPGDGMRNTRKRGLAG
jgi:DNA-binding NtrC family response regulator